MVSRRQSLAVSFLGLVGSFCFPGVQAFANESDVEINAVTEESILAFTENGKPAGPAVELVKATLEKAGLKYKIEILPWARSYKMAQDTKNVLIFPIAKTPEREKMFKWVDKLAPIEYNLYRKKSNTTLKIESLEAFKASKGRIGVVRDDVRHVYLKGKGFEDGKNLDPVNSNKLNLTKLVAGRIDVFPSTQLGILALCKEEPVACKELSNAFTLSDLTGAVYLALSLSTSEEVSKKIENAYAQLQKDGTYKKIMSEVLSAGQ